MLQLDSVSVAVRAHYAPVFSRLGPYDRDVLERAAWSHSARSPRLLVEYWAHEAALMAVDDWPLLRWRMREYARRPVGQGDRPARTAGWPRTSSRRSAEIGPSTAGQIEAHLEAEPRGRKGPWWDRSDTKWVAEALFASGVLTTATRVGFRQALRPQRARAAAGGVRQRSSTTTTRSGELVLRAATALGVATETDIRDYFRLGAKQAKPVDRGAGGQGELEPVEVDGWSCAGVSACGPGRSALGSRHRAAVPVRSADLLPARAWSGCSTSTTASRSTFPSRSASSVTTCGRSCWTGELVGRVDLKAERTRDALHVVGAFAEPGRDRGPGGGRAGARTAFDGVVAGAWRT